MKKQLLIVALAMFSITAFAQKKELKIAEKAIKKLDFKSAVTAINSVEGLIANADVKTKSKFYFLKGQAFGGEKEYVKAAKAYNDLFEFEKTSKKRYTDKAMPLFNKLKADVANEAFTLNEAKKFKESSKAFYLRYTLDKRDTLFLLNAARLAFQAKENETAFGYYMSLKNNGYTGISTVYEATDKASGKPVAFSDKKKMNLMMKTGNFENPQTKVSKSKKNDILKELVGVLTSQKKYNEAVTLIKSIRKEDPKNLQLLLAEAFLYNDLNQADNFKALMKEATSIDPNNPDLYFNIGIVNYNAGKVDEAAKYFTKTIEIKSDYPKGNLMLANTLLRKDEGLVKKMNDLPMSDSKNYAKYENERKTLFKTILPVLEKADKEERTESSVRMLIGVYEQLEMSNKAAELRKILPTLK